MIPRVADQGQQANLGLAQLGRTRHSRGPDPPWPRAGTQEASLSHKVVLRVFRPAIRQSPAQPMEPGKSGAEDGYRRPQQRLGRHVVRALPDGMSPLG